MNRAERNARLRREVFFSISCGGVGGGRVRIWKKGSAP